MTRLSLLERALLSLIGALALIAFSRPPASQAQAAPCGIVDDITYPIDISETLRERYDDFALFRNRFGGNHVGIDIGFNRWGEPVYAAARGQVTYSDPEGWDTEKGVVIVAHTFPDASVAYSLYGHVEQTDTISLPPVGACVELGQPVGAIGWPSRGLPHLHYEIRAILPNDGGPGYVTDNPLERGWFHPLDFTLLWRARLAGGYLASVSFDRPATQPPVLLDTTDVAVASGATVGVYGADGLRWSVTMPGAVIGLEPLPGGRLAAYARGGQAAVLQNGRFLAVWQVDGLEVPLQVMGDRLIFATAEGGLAAYDLAGAPLWRVNGDGAPSTDRAASLMVAPIGGGQAALSLRAAGQARLLVVDAAGAVQHRSTHPGASTVPVLAADATGWLALIGARLVRLTSEAAVAVTALTPPPGRGARLAVDSAGVAYVLLDDRAGSLVAVAPDGAVVWRADYPWHGLSVSPLVRADGCAVYTLDMDGALRAFSAGTGALLGERLLYAGGVRNGSPAARVLRAEGGRVLAGTGFLSLYLFDMAALTGGACPAG